MDYLYYISRMNKINNPLFLMFLLLITTEILYAQAYGRGTRWKRTRYEIIGGTTIANCMTDLGGGKMNTSKFDNHIGDFDYQGLRPGLYVGMRYKIQPKVNLRASFVGAYIKSDDKFSGRTDYHYRNLNFRSIIIEQSIVGEYNFIEEDANKKWSKGNAK
ncbi:MAG: hypothetical protein SNJ71_07240, partial [Bacteroidales bacterium]